ncbi:Apoptosis inhibitor 5, partial [Geodia barretti]
MAAEQSAGVEELYKNFGVLADAGETAGEKLAEYDGILQAAKGSANEKKLAAGFITRFYHLFPTMAETAMDTLLDLVEEENDMIRRTAIKALPDICKRSPDPALCAKVSEYLTQLLATEDVIDLALVKTGLASLLQKNTPAAMDGIFSQVGGEDEGVREQAIDYVSSSLMSMRHILFIPHPENEKQLVRHVKKVLSDVTGEEFEVFMEMLSKLQFLATAEGAQEVMDVIVQQAELSAEFKVEDGESVDRFITCFKQALKFCKVSSLYFPLATVVVEVVLVLGLYQLWCRKGSCKLNLSFTRTIH